MSPKPVTTWGAQGPLARVCEPVSGLAYRRLIPSIPLRCGMHLRFQKPWSVCIVKGLHTMLPIVYSTNTTCKTRHTCPPQGASCYGAGVAINSIQTSWDADQQTLTNAIIRQAAAHYCRYARQSVCRNGGKIRAIALKSTAVKSWCASLFPGIASTKVFTSSALATLQCCLSPVECGAWDRQQ